MQKKKKKKKKKKTKKNKKNVCFWGLTWHLKGNKFKNKDKKT